MKKIVAAMIIACACAGAVRGQDVHFSEFNETPLHLNPAYTGLFDGIYRISAHYRNQWTAMGSPYKTTAGSIDCAIGNPNRARLGIGVFLYKDQAGDSKLGTFNGSLSMSGLVKVDDYNTLSAGFMFGYAQRSADISTLAWENQYVNGTYDPNAPTGEGNLLTSFPYVDFAGGLAYQYRSVSGSLVGKDVMELNVGISAFHLNTPEQKFHGGGSEERPMRLVFHSHLRMDMPGTAWSIRPSVTYIQQAAATELMIGGAVRYRIKNGTKVTNFFSESGIGMGVHYRLKDAIVPQLYYDLGDFFIGLAYDINVSKYSAISKYQGGYEITIRYANLNGALYKNKR